MEAERVSFSLWMLLKPMLTIGREEPGDSQLPIINEWGGAWVIPGLRWGWFELSLARV
jgi:hypothetical protein